VLLSINKFNDAFLDNRYTFLQLYSDWISVTNIMIPLCSIHFIFKKSHSLTFDWLDSKVKWSQIFFPTISLVRRKKTKNIVCLISLYLHLPFSSLSLSLSRSLSLSVCFLDFLIFSPILWYGTPHLTLFLLLVFFFK